MNTPQGRAARVRKLFGLAVDTAPDRRDAVLRSEAGEDESLIAEVRALLAADADASAFQWTATPSGRPPWQVLIDTLQAAAESPATNRLSLLQSAADGTPSRVHDLEALLRLRQEGILPLDAPIVATVATLLEGGAARPLSLDEATLGLSEGRMLSHYRIESFLGAGGMGVVYTARDLALGRMAALKVLPRTFAPALKERLLLEADASARLQHPAIATHYESGEKDGTFFIAMELVAGETLRRRLSRGAVPVSEAVAWISCVLEALSHAHAAGILHRDIKPENIMVTGPRSSKLLDFGLAKHLFLEDAPTAANGQMAEAIAGTVGYMPPEQIRNDDQDPRSDLFQVGAVLYEMLTGGPAFPGVSVTERLVAVLARDPDPIDQPDVPPALAAIVMRALSRDPARRYPSAGLFLSSIRAVIAGEHVVQLPDAIAILDFDNLSQSPQCAWIGTGISEALAADLRRVDGIDVLPRERVSKVRAAIDAHGADAAAAAGLRLGCRWVLGGAFQTIGDALRVTMRLVETSTERTVVTENIDGTLTALFQIQDRIAALVVSALNVSTNHVLAAPTRPSVTAYENYIRGRLLFFTHDKGAMEQARALYEEAIQIEPTFAPALSGLAGFHAMQYTFTTDPRTLDTATDYAQRAIEADPTIADGWNWLGYAHHRRGQLDQAYKALVRATELDPSFFFPCYHLGNLSYVLGKTDQGLRFAQRAVELEPALTYPIWALGCWHLLLGGYAEADWTFQRTAVVDQAADTAARWPGHEGFHGECLRRMGRLEQAHERCLAGLEDVEKSDHMFRDTNRVVCLNALGRTALQRGDVDAARAAYGQATVHVQGRQRTLSGGFLLVQALVGLARANDNRALYAQARGLYQRRDRFDFSPYWLCLDDTTALDLARAAAALGLIGESNAWRQRAIAHHSSEARRGLP